VVESPPGVHRLTPATCGFAVNRLTPSGAEEEFVAFFKAQCPRSSVPSC
jgi:hypothetical protein